MNNSKQATISYPLVGTGLLFIALSEAAFLVPDLFGIKNNSDSLFGLFMLNYIFAIVYMVILASYGIINFKWSFSKISVEHTLILLILFLISAFSLNKQIPVFEKSTPWLGAYLTGLCLTIILLVFREKLPVLIRHVLFFLLGGGLIIYAYFAMFLFPMYLLCSIGGIFFGISWHVFTPLLFTIFTMLLLLKALKENRAYLYPFVAGSLFPMAVALVFLIQWQRSIDKINYVLNESVISETTLPLWARLSRQIPKTAVMEKIMKTDLVYTTPAENSFWNMGIPNRSFDDVRLHDPLVMVACFLLGKPDLTETDKIKILESMYDSRHQAQERLWAGDELKTANVISNIKIFPEYRIAYTEKILSVSNNGEKSRWRNQQEAIYTFHLPEGGVVTSLSLWINGREEKGILTTKSKADSAYTTIVGVEQRDPSVIHWQEGNTVSVRVFPCTPEENRRFKVGVTAPLRKQGSKLVYENIYFDGPSGQNATETVKIQFNQKPSQVELPFKLAQSGNYTYKTDKSYDPYWEMSFAAPEIATSPFSFAGCSYSVEEYKKQYESFTPEVVYLDVNSSWTKEEFMKVWNEVQNKRVFVYQEEMIKLEQDNLDRLFEELTQFNFSLFPIQLIKYPENAILISKSNGASPNLQDIKGSEFSENLLKALKNHREIRFFNLDHTLSPYLKTLKETRVLRYDQGNTADLANLLKRGQFVKSQENDSAIVIDNAQIIIREQGTVNKGTAPDHLLRLFAYNHIMERASENYFNDNFINDSLVAEAQKAYVVSPVFSLIVLETKVDYERFDIKDSENSLKNASTKSSGSVPEPHEWLLIIFTGLVVMYMLSKRNPFS